MRKIFMRLIRFYQKNISPLKPPSCRFSPSCSVYTYQAIERFGAPKGCLLGFLRIMRCCPLFPGGYDPVPDEWPRRRRKKNGAESVNENDAPEDLAQETSGDEEDIAEDIEEDFDGHFEEKFGNDPESAPENITNSDVWQHCCDEIPEK